MTDSAMSSSNDKKSRSQSLTKNYLIGSAVIGMVVGVGLEFTRDGRALSPTVAIALATLAPLLVIAGMYYYIKKTDEHDLHAHLWSTSIAWLFLAAIVPSWWLLARVNLVPQIDGMVALFGSAIVGSIVWAWLRYR